MNNDEEKLISYLSRFVGRDRMSVFRRVLQNRTRYLTVVLEDIYQTQNASAVLRSCDCFGIQDVHIIENQNTFRIHSGVTQGSAKWLGIHRYRDPGDNTLVALSALRNKGYRIVATVPDPAAVSLENFNLDAGKAALVFGSEKPGVSSDVKRLADEYITIPMVGFTGSLNISVSAATIVYHLTSRLRQSQIDWTLDPEERNQVLLQWLRRQIKGCDLLEKHFYLSGDSLQ